MGSLFSRVGQEIHSIQEDLNIKEGDDFKYLLSEVEKVVSKSEYEYNQVFQKEYPYYFWKYCNISNCYYLIEVDKVNGNLVERTIETLLQEDIKWFCKNVLTTRHINPFFLIAVVNTVLGLGEKIMTYKGISPRDVRRVDKSYITLLARISKDFKGDIRSIIALM